MSTNTGGGRAQYRGTGYINNDSSTIYKFTLTGVDAGSPTPPPGKTDLFRIKVDNPSDSTRPIYGETLERVRG